MRAFDRVLAVAGASLIIAATISCANAGGDPTKGQQAFAKCAACHAKDSSNRLGPGLLGVVGRQAGAVQGFRYSRAMMTASIVWDDKSLDAFLSAPQKAVPGNSMSFAGISDPQQRTDLIAYLASLK